jgi:hypothetical protein
LGSPFKYFVQATFFQNIGYVGWGNRFIIPQGLLIFKLILLVGFSFYIFAKRKKLSISSIFIILWFAFSMFNAFFAQRPYTHYLLVILPSLSLLVGLIFLEKKYKLLFIGILIMSLLFIFSNFNLYKKTLFYYQNFIAFISGTKSVSDYRGFFDRRTPNDYSLAEYIKLKTDKKDQIFLPENMQSPIT